MHEILGKAIPGKAIVGNSRQGYFKQNNFRQFLAKQLRQGNSTKAIFPDKATQGNYSRKGNVFQAKQGKVRQGKAIPGKAIPGSTRQNNFR